MHITTNPAPIRAEHITRRAAIADDIAPRRSPEAPALTPQEIREIVLEILG